MPECVSRNPGQFFAFLLEECSHCPCTSSRSSPPQQLRNEVIQLDIATATWKVNYRIQALHGYPTKPSIEFVAQHHMRRDHVRAVRRSLQVVTHPSSSSQLAPCGGCRWLAAHGFVSDTSPKQMVLPSGTNNTSHIISPATITPRIGRHVVWSPPGLLAL